MTFDQLRENIRRGVQIARVPNGDEWPFPIDRLQQHHGDPPRSGGVGTPREIPRVDVVVALANVKLVGEGVSQTGVAGLCGEVVAPDAPPRAKPLQFRPCHIPDVDAAVLLDGGLVLVEAALVGAAVIAAIIALIVRAISRRALRREDEQRVKRWNRED